MAGGSVVDAAGADHADHGGVAVVEEPLEALQLPGLVLITYTVEPGSQSEQSLGFLASWSAQETPRAATGRPEQADDRT